MTNPAPLRLKIINQRGLHARAAARFAKLAGRFAADIVVKRDGQAAAGDSILELLMLGAGVGEEIMLSATGKECEAALKALAELVSGGFDESD